MTTSESGSTVASVYAAAKTLIAKGGGASVSSQSISDATDISLTTVVEVLKRLNAAGRVLFYIEGDTDGQVMEVF